MQIYKKVCYYNTFAHLLPGIDAQMHQILIHPITHVVNGEHE